MRSYRPTIDGLRAIAVISVLLYHARFMWHGRQLFSGGFIGVDVFFVISGYLITSLILGDLQSRFSLCNFYERRARRILPVLFTVMLATLPFTWFYMLPEQMETYAGSLFYTLLFTSNIWFYTKSGYWDEAGTSQPFLHSWSLSIEEQFYAVYPLLLLLIWKYARGHMGWILAAIAGLSLACACLMVQQQSQWAFYLLPSRLWELLAGGLLAYAQLSRGDQPVLRHGWALQLAGLGMIGWAVLRFTPETPHPSWMTLIPVAGTLLVLVSQGGLLANPVLRGVGLVSYGLYLWHYPVYVFFGMWENVTLTHKLSLIAMSFALAVLSYYWVEKPFRQYDKARRLALQAISGAFGLLLAVMAVLHFTHWVSDIRSQQAAKYVLLNYWRYEADEQSLATYPGCWVPDGEMVYADNPFEGCEAAEIPSGDRNRLLLLGDSNVATLVPGLLKHFDREQIVQRSVSACMPGKPSATRKCLDAYNHVYANYKSLGVSTIVFGGRYRKPRDIDNILREVTGHFTIPKSRMILVGPLPRWGESSIARRLPNRLFSMYFSGEKDRLMSELYLDADPVTFVLDDYARKKAAQYGVRYLSPVAVLCKREQGVCLAKKTQDAYTTTTWDYGHLTGFAAGLVVDANIDLLKPR